MALNYPTTPAIDNLSSIILTAAARMVAESGVVDDLKEAIENAEQAYAGRVSASSVLRLKAALANLAKLEGRG